MIVDNYSCPHLFAEGVNSAKFAEMVSDAILKTLQNRNVDLPRQAVDQWKTMSLGERLTFISASLECFYWVYVERNKALFPFWEAASIIQKVERAAGFCLFVLGTEFEEVGANEFPGADTSPSKWIN
jgi:hypothetical protein